MSGRSRERAARRAAASGAGHTDAVPGRFPGAVGVFALFGEVLLTGVLVTVASLLVVTLPAGLVAGTRHLGRYLRAEDSSVSVFWRDVRSSLAGGAVVGAVSLAIAAVLTVDLLLAGTGSLPGGQAILVVGWAGIALLAVALCTAAGLWGPDGGWRAAVRGVPAAWRQDPAAAGLLLLAVGLTGVLTWMLTPIVVPALGCVCLAVFAVPQRRRRGQG